MNREIKFRAWDNINKQMTLDVHHLDSLNEIISKRKYDLMQFTGLKDKNKVEIYEGDIVRITIQGYGMLPHYHLCLIVYNIDGFQGCNLLKKIKSKFENKEYLNMPKRFNYNEWGKMEVIGNLYENPELLNQ